MLEADAVDVIQVDATRAAGITGFLAAAVLADAFHLPFSAHTAPPFTSIPAAWFLPHAISNTFTITCESSRCFSMEFSNPSMELYIPIRPVRGSGSKSNEPTPRNMPHRIV